MAENLVINGTTYNGVESVELNTTEGKKVLFFQGQPVSVVQETGDSTTAIMSQKAVTDALAHHPVCSVNGKTGAVSLSASDVGARPSSWTPTAANVGAVPTSRKVNGKALSADITLSAADVGAVPTSSKLTVTGVDADGVTHTWTMYGASV